jgi:hypothetical protein
MVALQSGTEISTAVPSETLLTFCQELSYLPPAQHCAQRLSASSEFTRSSASATSASGSSMSHMAATTPVRQSSLGGSSATASGPDNAPTRDWIRSARMLSRASSHDPTFYHKPSLGLFAEISLLLYCCYFCLPVPFMNFSSLAMNKGFSHSLNSIQSTKQIAKAAEIRTVRIAELLLTSAA